MTKDFQIGLWVETSLAKELRELAEKDRRNFSDYLRGVLEDHVISKRKKALGKK